MILHIYPTDPNPSAAIHSLDNRRFNNAVYFTARILSTALILSGVDHEEIYAKWGSKSPWASWAMETRSNFTWLVSYAATGANYRPHASRPKIMRAAYLADAIPDGARTPFPRIASRNPKVGGRPCFMSDSEAYSAYRKYLTTLWLNDKHMPKWTGDARACPEWALDKLQAHYGEENVPDLMFHVYDSTGYRLVSRRSQNRQGEGGQPKED